MECEAVVKIRMFANVNDLGSPTWYAVVDGSWNVAEWPALAQQIFRLANPVKK